MSQFIKSLTLILLFSLIGCSSQKHITQTSDLNTVYNNEYEKSKLLFRGELEKEVYDQVRSTIESELGVLIPEDKAILINYYQKGQNCISMRLNRKNYLRSVKYSAKTSARICSKNKTIDFFVFSNDAFFKEQIKDGIYNKFDSGFFYDNIFTIHNNCQAFFILKPNGKFMKYYGEDYYTRVKKFLEENDLNKLEN